MDIKIPSGSGPGSVETSDVGEAAVDKVEGAQRTEQGIEVSDVVSRVVEELAGGNIQETEALEKILAEIMDSKMIEAAPPEIKAELEDVLRALIETDPYLKTLALDLGLKFD